MHKSSLPPGHPAAVWAAFAQQGAWKSWIIIALLVLNGLLIVAGARLARRQPDIVVVGPDGKSAFVERSLATRALLDYLAEQRLKPSDLTVVRFTRDFVRLSLSANSSTVDATWKEALSMMAPILRDRLAKESERQRLLETYKQLRVRTAVTVDDVDVIEHTPELLQVRATVLRMKAPILDDASQGVPERMIVDLVERVIPRTLLHPDGLEVVEWKVAIQRDLPAAAVHHAQ